MNNNRKKILRILAVIALCLLYLTQYPFHIIAGTFRNLFLFGDPVRWLRYILRRQSEYAVMQLSILLVVLILLISIVRLILLILRGRVNREKASDEISRSRRDMPAAAGDRYMKQLRLFLDSGLITQKEYMDLLSHHEKER